MDKLQLGMAVFSVDDRRMGDVGQINRCCFELNSDGARTFIELDGIFNVDSFRVTLICAPTEAGRYACRLHTK